MTGTPKRLLGGIEAGGTKFICGVGTGPENLRTASIPTTQPDETLRGVLEFFAQQEPVAAVGIGSFGPVDLHPESATYGWITSTPKPGWANTDLRGAVERALRVPVSFDTDVNAALRGEMRWGAAVGLTDAVYLTVGTGVGGGAASGGRIVHGLVHPEMGHLRVPRDPVTDPFAGICPYHGDCLEGLACGPALQARWKRPGAELPADHPAWDLEARYLASALMDITLVLSPQRIVLGGGVMNNSFLLPKVQQEFVRLLGGYVRHSRITDGAQEFIVAPKLGSQSGVLGSLVLAEEAQ